MQQGVISLQTLRVTSEDLGVIDRKCDFDTIVAVSSSQSITDVLLLIRRSYFGQAAVVTVRTTCDSRTTSKIQHVTVRVSEYLRQEPAQNIHFTSYHHEVSH